MIKYMVGKNGVGVIPQEGSYTSKCSLLVNGSVEKHDAYLGRNI